MSRTHPYTANACNRKVTGVNPTVPFWILNLPPTSSFFVSLEVSLKKGVLENLSEFERWKNSNGGSKEWGTMGWLVVAETWTLSSRLQQFHSGFSYGYKPESTNPALCPIPFHLYAQTRNKLGLGLYPFTKLMCFSHSHTSCTSVPCASVASIQLSQPQLYYSFSLISAETQVPYFMHTVLTSVQQSANIQELSPVEHCGNFPCIGT